MLFRELELEAGGVELLMGGLELSELLGEVMITRRNEIDAMISEGRI